MSLLVFSNVTWYIFTLCTFAIGSERVTGCRSESHSSILVQITWMRGGGNFLWRLLSFQFKHDWEYCAKYSQVWSFLFLKFQYQQWPNSWIGTTFVALSKCIVIQWNMGLAQSQQWTLAPVTLKTKRICDFSSLGIPTRNITASYN